MVPTGSVTGLEVVAQLARRVPVRAGVDGYGDRLDHIGVGATTSARPAVARWRPWARVRTPAPGWVARIGDLVVTVRHRGTASGRDGVAGARCSFSGCCCRSGPTAST